MAEFLRCLDVRCVLHYYEAVAITSYIAWRSTFMHKVNRARQIMQAEELTASILPEPPRIPPHSEG